MRTIQALQKAAAEAEAAAGAGAGV